MNVLKYSLIHTGIDLEVHNKGHIIKYIIWKK